MKSIFHFGEIVPGYKTRVLNEREARAASGILFTFALISFFYAFVLGDFYFIKIFVTAFSLDFLIRVCINPSLSPTMIIGRIVTSNQKVEYTGAPQKRFAWTLGLVLALSMFVLMVVMNTASPINFVICGLCLVLMFFETAFGICLGCLLYNYFTTGTAQYCPGDSCETIKKEPIQYIGIIHALLVAGFIGGIIVLPTITATSPIQALNVSQDCVIPDWVHAIGHEELWLEHNGCTDNETIGKDESVVIPASIPSEIIDPNDPCQNIPEGHPEDLWLIHNGCLG